MQSIILKATNIPSQIEACNIKIIIKLSFILRLNIYQCIWCIYPRRVEVGFHLIIELDHYMSIIINRCYISTTISFPNIFFLYLNYRWFEVCYIIRSINRILIISPWYNCVGCIYVNKIAWKLYFILLNVLEYSIVWNFKYLINYWTFNLSTVEQYFINFE